MRPSGSAFIAYSTGASSTRATSTTTARGKAPARSGTTPMARSRRRPRGSRAGLRRLVGQHPAARARRRRLHRGGLDRAPARQLGRALLPPRARHGHPRRAERGDAHADRPRADRRWTLRAVACHGVQRESLDREVPGERVRRAGGAGRNADHVVHDGRRSLLSQRLFITVEPEGDPNATPSRSTMLTGALRDTTEFGDRRRSCAPTSR